MLHQLALPTFQRFADAWGYEVSAIDLPRDGRGADPLAQAAKWAKVQLLRGALQDYDTVLWVDADVLIRAPTRTSPPTCVRETSKRSHSSRFLPSTG